MEILDKRWFEVVFTLFLIVAFFFIKEILRSLVKRQEQKYNLDVSRSVYILKFLSYGLFILLIVSLFAVWNVETKSLYVYFGSFFTVAGAAFFAQWSVFSNITASIVLFFNFPVKIGSRIKIMDKDDTTEGIVHDITFFTIQLKTDEGNIVYYPTNVAIQKGIVEIFVETN